MDLFGNFRLRNKLILGVLVPVFASVVIFLIVLRHFEVYEKYLGWVIRTHTVIEQAQVVEKAIVDIDSSQRGFLMTGLEEYLESYQLERDDLPKKLTSIVPLISDNPKQGYRLNQISLLVNEWVNEVVEPVVQKRRKLKGNNEVSTIERIVRPGEGKKHVDNLKRKLSEFVAEEFDLLNEREKNLKNLKNTIKSEIIGGLIVVVLLNVLVSWFTSGSISRRLNNLNQAITKVSNGDLDGEQIMITSDEVGELAKSFKKMTDALKEVKIKNNAQIWLSEGQEGLLDAIRNEETLEKLSLKVLDFLLPYTKAVAGTVYIRPAIELDDIDFGVHIKKYHLRASVGLKKESLVKTIFENETLLGRVAKLGKTEIVKEFPNDYMVLSTSMGSFKPKEVLIAPLKVYGNVVALIELVSDQSFHENVMVLLDRVEDALATSITTLESQTSLSESNNMLTESTRLLQLKEEFLQKTNRELEEKSKEIESASEELKVKAEELALASNYKSEFLANMSHELRTPLNSLLILAKYLGDNVEGNLTDEQVTSIGIIHSGGQELLAIINDILDLSKVEAGHMNINIERGEIRNVTENLRRQFDVVANEKGIDFIVEIDEEVPEFINMDGLRVTQVLRNYLSNAFKFTETGSVRLKVERISEKHMTRREDFNKEKALCFSVKDTGMGIAEDRQKEVFEAFQQADGSTTRTHGGTGLGLTISKEMAELMGGEVFMESELGKGTTMYFYLPSDIACDVEEFSESAMTLSKKVEDKEYEPVVIEVAEGFELNEEMKGKHILLVDDDMRNVFSLKQQLNENGLKVTVADNGEKALEKLSEGMEVDIVLMDWIMPVMDGIETTKALRSNSSYCELPIITMTAKMQQENKHEALKAGANEFISKPIRINVLLEMIQYLVLSEDQAA